MISDRLHLLFYFLLAFGCEIGAFSFEYNIKSLKVSKSANQNAKAKVYLGTTAGLAWLLFCLYITLQEFLCGEINLLIFKLIVTVGAMILLVLWTIPLNHANEVAKIINGTFEYLRYVQRKLKYKKIDIVLSDVFVNLFF